MTEATLAARIVRALNALPGVYAERVWTGGSFARVGRPDITGCRRGQRFDLEVKVPGKRERRVQAWERERGYLPLVLRSMLGYVETGFRSGYAAGAADLELAKQSERVAAQTQKAAVDAVAEREARS